MSYELESYSDKATGVTCKIVSDDNPLNPRKDYDNLGTIVYKSRDYILGDEEIEPGEFYRTLFQENATDAEKRAYVSKCWAWCKENKYADVDIETLRYLKDGATWQDVADELVINDYYATPTPDFPAGVIIIPVYAYIHSGVTIRAGSGFSCPWDSGQCGWIYVTRETVEKEYGNYSEESQQKARKVLESEIETFDQYLTGDVWGYVIEDRDGEELESCWGFFGDDYAKEEAKDVFDRCVKDEAEKQEAKRQAENAALAEMLMSERPDMYLLTTAY